MLLSELVGARVVTTAGDELGHVHDVLLVQDAPVGASGPPARRLHALAVGRRSFGTKLGYAQGTVRGPWILRALLHKAPRLVQWRAGVERNRERIVVDAELLEESDRS